MGQRFAWATALVAAVFAIAGCVGHSAKTESPGAVSTVAPSGDLLSDVRQRGIIVIATDANYSPQSVHNPDGSWSGFDVEVAREIAKRLGVRPVFKAANFDFIVRGHWLGGWDIDVGSMANTPERANVLWFSKTYYYVPGSIAVKSSSGTSSLADLAGKRIGVTAATTFQSFLHGKLSGKLSMNALHLTVVPYDMDSRALQDLAAGSGRHIDAVLTSLPTINSAIKEGMPIRVIGGPVFEDRSAVALDRSSFHEPLNLLLAIDAIIDAMHRDGTLRRLSEKYYHMDLSRG